MWPIDDPTETRVCDAHLYDATDDEDEERATLADMQIDEGDSDEQDMEDDQ